MAAPARAQERISPLPPPVTRSLYRTHWFVYLNAYLEDDARAAAGALEQLKKAALAVGVRRLSDFSRTALYEARRAEASGRIESADRGYGAALELDDANLNAALGQIALLVRQGSYARAARMLPVAARALVSTEERRLSVASSLLLCICLGAGAAVAATIIILLARHLRRVSHDVRETADRLFGRRAAVPLALVLFLLPLGFGLGPFWILLFWGALLYIYADRRERMVLAVGLLALGLIPVAVAAISRENVIERSPLYVAAIDLEERREDASAEAGLRQASVVFAEDPDVWFLLGVYAERAGDSQKAMAAYDQAVRAGPSDYRPYLNRGNMHFQEGEFAQAIGDYEVAAEKAPRAAEIFYNIALARAETYDFDGQAAALNKARELSSRSVTYWSQNPTLARVVSAPYTVSRARRKIEEWNGEPRGRALPGHAPPFRVARTVLSTWALGPWAALLLALAITRGRRRRGAASECLTCGRPFCRYCKRYGEPPAICTPCARLRKEGIESQVTHAVEVRRRVRRRDWTCRLTSLLLPGTHRFFSQRPVSGAFVLLLFFFLLATAWTGATFFTPRRLALPVARADLAGAALVAAAVLWIAELFSAWRHSHGS